jgi:hypothetical protein
MTRGDALVFCTLEMGIFGLIFEGQLMVWIRQIESENENLFENHFIDLQIQILWKTISSHKKVPCFCKCEVNGIY